MSDLEKTQIDLNKVGKNTVTREEFESLKKIVSDLIEKIKTRNF